MKVLILSCNAGGGHNSVAAAIKDVYENHGDNVTVCDTLSFLPPGCSEIVSNTHSYVYRHAPIIFRSLYHHTDVHRKRSFSKRRLSRQLLDIGIGKLSRYIDENQFDQVICCHVFAGIMLTDMRAKGRLNVPCCLIETDYTITPGSEKCNVDFHFVPCNEIKDKLEGMSNVRGKVIVSGIPVRKQFYDFRFGEEAKRELGLNEKCRNILITSGSMGCGPIEEIISELQKKLAYHDNIEICVICGTNNSLYDSLVEKYGHNKAIHIFGHMDNMSLFLDAADVYITKPGGISVTEAALKAKPIVLINVVGGCEQYNLDLFLNKGGALTGDTPQLLSEKAMEICCDPSLHISIESALKRIISENDPEIIYQNMMLISKGK